MAGRLTAEATSFAAGALLLDMDGVLVDSTTMVEANWSRWARRRGLGIQDVLEFAHGSPSRDVVARFVPPDEVTAEAAWVEELALEPTSESALPGALAALTQQRLPVAVVTSATGEVARVRLRRAGLPLPPVLVSADDVERGKPDPQPYLRAAEALGIEPARCVGVEDTPAGLAALRAAGAVPLGLLTTHRAEQLSDAASLVRDLAALHIDATGVSLQR